MEPISKHVDPFKIAGISARTSNANEADLKKAVLPGLWRRFYDEDVMVKIPLRITGSPIYSVYSNYESDMNGEYDVTVGVQISETIAPQKDFSVVEVGGGEHLVFNEKGEMPHAVAETWRKVWDFFAKDQAPKRKYSSDFEMYYKGSDSIEVYIAVE